MNKHIILTAFGTTTRALSTYEHLDARIRPSFPDCQIHWSYSSATVRRALSPDGDDKPASLANLLDRLGREPGSVAVIQSLHILPGFEFHRLVQQVRQTAFPAVAGMPLLTDPIDYQRLSRCLLPLITDRAEDAAILVLGHGTSHPCWTAYPALEAILRREAGRRLFVATLEKFPDSGAVIDTIVSQGFKKVLIIPLLLVAGMHFQRDILSDAPTSWQSRLTRQKISLSLHNQGLGLLPGVAEIFCSHISRAFEQLGKKQAEQTANASPTASPAG